ncbi:MAG: TlpA family protein disulfide reductase, partial [Alphaproteobacteria bacterium]|nr:TlpA family protein disulfide reductase [Alphaproteobacteria bacterium]
MRFKLILIALVVTAAIAFSVYDRTRKPVVVTQADTTQSTAAEGASPKTEPTETGTTEAAAPEAAPVKDDKTHHETDIDATTKLVDVPGFSVGDLTGRPRALADYRGKTIILNFWASWCAPCRTEFPDLLELAARHPDDLVLFAVSTDTDKTAVDKFLDGLKGQAKDDVKLPNVVIALDPQQAISKDLFQTVSFPETYIVDPDFKIRRKIVGPADWTGDDVSAILNKIAKP